MGEAEIRRIVILGGGTAGWLSACYVSARLAALGQKVEVTLVEAPDIPTIGVGEGTWPTMRGTLAQIGIDEAAFLTACDASFKQGSRFVGWTDGGAGDAYLHPFTAPREAELADLVAAWAADGASGFAAALTAQDAAVAHHLAPRQVAMPDYAGALNYGYHLDAGKFAALLARHAVERLGVIHRRERVVPASPQPDGTLAALVTASGEAIPGDLFLDCSGLAGLLVGGALGVPLVDRSDVLLNDRALAVQVPVQPGSPIASATVATAHAAGWIWDIGLPNRRGIGCVYASHHCDDDEALATLRDYVARAVPGVDAGSIEPRRLAFPTGYRATPWTGNCVAIGLSAGFLEPLEASAIVMIELSLRALVESFPQRRATMPFLAERFNALFTYRFERIVEFLKLHYLLSRRTEPYWQAQRAPETVPPRLAAMVELWRDQAPGPADFPHADEIFSAHSHAFVLYGMGFSAPRRSVGSESLAQGRRALGEVARRTRTLTSALPPHRAYLDTLEPGRTAAHGALARS
jgi:hypothetical protein